MPDRSLTLLDTLISPPKGVRYARLVESILSKGPIARRYILDESASSMLGEFIRDHLDLMLDSIEFARAPFPVTYLEIDSRALFRSWRPNDPIQPTSDVTIGYLIDGADVAVLVGGEDGVAQPAPLSFSLNRPQSLPITRLTGLDADAADLVKQAYVLGGKRRRNGAAQPDGMLGGVDVDLSHVPREWSTSQIAAHFDVRPIHESIPPKLFVNSAFFGGGDPLTVLVALLLLNQPSHFTAMHVPRSTGIHKGKRKTYKEHNVISVSLEARESLLHAFSAGGRASPIRHEVEGHWRNYNRHDGCTHHWQPIGSDMTSSGDHRRYWCPRCLQRRTWTESFSRGDALKGYGTAEHKVSR